MKKKMVFILALILVLLIAFGGWFVLHEKTQNENITTLIDKVDILSRSVQELTSRDNREEKKAVEFPKWLKIYFKCFNLTENFKELYNFSLNSTDINNDSGLTYIRGLKSFSFFFLIF